MRVPLYGRVFQGHNIIHIHKSLQASIRSIMWGPRQGATNYMYVERQLHLGGLLLSIIMKEYFHYWDSSMTW